MKLFEFPFWAARDEAGRILVRSFSPRRPARHVPSLAELSDLRRFAILLGGLVIAATLAAFAANVAGWIGDHLFVAFFLAAIALGLVLFRLRLRQFPAAGSLIEPDIFRAFELDRIDQAEMRRQGLRLWWVGVLLIALVVLAAALLQALTTGSGMRLASATSFLVLFQGAFLHRIGANMLWLARETGDAEKIQDSAAPPTRSAK